MMQTHRQLKNELPELPALTRRWLCSYSVNSCRDGNHFTSAAEGHAHSQSHTCTPGRKPALLAPTDDRSRDRRLALKSSREHGVLKMSDRNQQALFCNMFNQITMGCLCINVCGPLRVYMCVCTQPNIGSDGHLLLYTPTCIHKVNPIVSHYPAGKQLFKVKQIWNWAKSE